MRIILGSIGVSVLICNLSHWRKTHIERGQYYDALKLCLERQATVNEFECRQSVGEDVSQKDLAE